MIQVIYYELSKVVADRYTDGHQYWFKIAPTDVLLKTTSIFLQISERVWYEDSEGVVNIIKSRTGNMIGLIDKRQRFLIKLSARNIENIV